MKDVLIEIKGTQTVNGEDNVVSLTTVGKMNVIGGKTYLKYDDCTSSESEAISCLIKVDPKDDSVVMQRSGTFNSRMYIKKGQRHTCHYETVAGTIVMGIFGENVKNELGDDGGRLSMSYTIDVNYGMLSRNSVEISVKEV